MRTPTTVLTTMMLVASHTSQARLIRVKRVTAEVLSTTKLIDLSGLSNGAYTAFFWKDLERIHRVTLVKQ